MASILITGVSSGIGEAVARRFAREGWAVTGTVRQPETFDSTRLPDVTIEGLDLSIGGSATGLAQRVLSTQGCPDVLVNNAGVLQWGPVELTSAAELERVFLVNVFSQIELIREIVPSMRERGSGTIVNVTSLGGRMVFPFFTTYNASKHAMEGFSEGLWHELKPFGIRVKAVEPGFVETPIWDKTLKDAQGRAVEGPPPYTSFMASMAGFERSISKRTSAADAAEEVYAAIADTSDRLRYPIAAYARPILRARRYLGDRFMMRFFHTRWMKD
jgi:NAD(P)-dependent dehydrogenase (short-subunit alcohol dehydrogenase family)